MVPKLKTNYPSVQEKIFVSPEKIALTKIRTAPTPPTIAAHQTATRPTVTPVKVASRPAPIPVQQKVTMRSTLLATTESTTFSKPYPS
jgi:hypothetical protein